MRSQREYSGRRENFAYGGIGTHCHRLLWPACLSPEARRGLRRPQRYYCTWRLSCGTSAHPPRLCAVRGRAATSSGSCGAKRCAACVSGRNWENEDEMIVAGVEDVAGAPLPKRKTQTPGRSSVSRGSRATANAGSGAPQSVGESAATAALVPRSKDGALAARGRRGRARRGRVRARKPRCSAAKPPQGFPSHRRARELALRNGVQKRRVRETERGSEGAVRQTGIDTF